MPQANSGLTSEAALNVAFGIGKSLAVFRGKQPGQIVIFALNQLEELEHDAERGAAVW